MTTWRRSLEARSRFKPYNRRRTPARHWKYLATSWHPLDGGALHGLGRVGESYPSVVNAGDGLALGLRSAAGWTPKK